MYHSRMVLTVLRRAYPPAALAWAAALPAATFAATRAHAPAIAHACAFAVYAIGALVCHQKPERSFHLWTAQLPVCARCTGIYVGAVLGLVLRSGRTSRTLLIAAVVPTAATLVFEWTTGIMPSNAIRFAAGLPLGMVVSWLVLK